MNLLQIKLGRTVVAQGGFTCSSRSPLCSLNKYFSKMEIRFFSTCLRSKKKISTISDVNISLQCFLYLTHFFSLKTLLGSLEQINSFFTHCILVLAFGGVNIEPSVRSCFEQAGDKGFIEVRYIFVFSSFRRSFFLDGIDSPRKKTYLVPFFSCRAGYN